MNQDNSNRFLLVDGHAIIYRAYHAFPALSTPEGLLVNAVYGFSRILLTAIRDLTPTYVMVAFDHKGKTNRAKTYEQYKAHRPAMPDDLRPQIDLIKQIVESLNIPQFSVEGYEADDLIGTITIQLSEKIKAGELEPVQMTIVTGDRDLFQLVNGYVSVWLSSPGRGQGEKEYGREEVREKSGVFPEQIVDLKALMGDASDNIPGVKGVGVKTATRLIQDFDHLDGVYEAAAAAVAGVKDHPALTKNVVNKLMAEKEMAYVSQGLAKIDREAPIEFELEDCRVTEYDKSKVSELFEQMEFRSLISLLPKDKFELEVQGSLF
jgi:DNA polymerase I